VLALAACATRPAPNFRGRWQPVNRLPDAPVAIPLQESYEFSAGPMDRTLKTLLTRWARGSKRTLSYLHPNDFTLYAPVEGISTTSLEQAVAQLNGAYASYDVLITLEAGQITVRRAQENVASQAAAPQ
jgi:hypothetical protein